LAAFQIPCPVACSGVIDWICAHASMALGSLPPSHFPIKKIPLEKRYNVSYLTIISLSIQNTRKTL
ncbi:MAG: hypothetical protein NC092_09820, partial [Butyrivibrio sp.]|nr:hypothetical protein [Butyrivibrio sp.]